MLAVGLGRTDAAWRFPQIASLSSSSCSVLCGDRPHVSKAPGAFLEFGSEPLHSRAAIGGPRYTYLKLLWPVRLPYRRRAPRPSVRPSGAHDTDTRSCCGRSALPYRRRAPRPTLVSASAGKLAAIGGPRYGRHEVTVAGECMPQFCNGFGGVSGVHKKDLRPGKSRLGTFPRCLG